MADEKDCAAESPLQIQPKPVRGRPFPKGQSGNPAGKHKGTRNRVTLLLETLLEGQAEAIMQKVIDKGLTEGDMRALTFLLERLVPRRLDRIVPFELPKITYAEDAVNAYSAVTAAVADGMLTPAEAGQLSHVIEAQVHAIEVTDVELSARARVLEELRPTGQLPAKPDKPKR
jgi:Family of unknown function (DUF5681)